MLRLIEAIKLIDFSEQELLNDCVQIGYLTKGIFSYNDIKNLDFEAYSILKKACKVLADELNKNQQG